MILLNSINYWSRLFHDWLTNNSHIDIANHQQIVFITHSRFCPLSTPPPFFLMANIKLDGIWPNLNETHTYACFTLYFKFWRYFLEKVMIQLPCYILLLCISLYINIYHFYNFFEIYLSLSFSQKYFCHKFLWIFMDSPKIPLPLLGGQHPILLAKKGMLIFEKKRHQKFHHPYSMSFPFLHVLFA